MLRTLFIVLVIAVGLVGALRSRFMGLLLYLWFALFRPQEFTWVDFSSLHLSLVIGIVFVVPCLLTGEWPDVSHPLSIGGLTFLLTALVAQIGCVNQDVGWYWLDFMARLLLVCLLCITLTNSRERFLAVLAVVSLSFGFHTSKAGLYSILHGGSRFGEGLAGAFIDNNGYAVGMVIVLWLLVATAQNMERKWVRRGILVAVPLTAFATVSTFSRGGFIGLAVSTACFILFQRHRLIAAIAMGFLLSAIPFVPLPHGYTERLQTIQTYDKEQDASALGRLHFWNVAISMAISNPLGVGLFNYESNYDRYDTSGGEFGQRRAVHSSYFQVLAETGFAGAAVYGWMLAYSMVLTLRIRRRAHSPGLSTSESRFLETSANALAASMVGFMGAGAFIALALNDLTWLTFALIASLDRLSVKMSEAGPRSPNPLADASCSAYSRQPRVGLTMSTIPAGRVTSATH
jgi:probable O-glycosylation ligase (exosortase A-associated)